MVDEARGLDSRLDTHSQEMQKLKDDIRQYFSRIDCSLRVLGSQFGLEPSELTDLENRSAQTSINPRELLLEECFTKEKITSMDQFVSVLDRRILRQTAITNEIRKSFGGALLGRQFSMESATSSVSMASWTAAQSPTQSFTSSMEASLTSSIGLQTGSKSVQLNR